MMTCLHCVDVAVVVVDVVVVAGGGGGIGVDAAVCDHPFPSLQVLVLSAFFWRASLYVHANPSVVVAVMRGLAI